MKKICGVTFLFLFLSVVATFASSENAQILDAHWKIAVSSSEVPIGSTFRKASILNVKTHHGDITFVSKDEVPQSIKSVKNRIEEDRGDPKSLKIIKMRGEVLFRFTSNDSVHWYSTRGGHLTLVASPKLWISAEKKVKVVPHG